MLLSPRVARMVGSTQMTPQYTSESLAAAEFKNIDAKTAALTGSLAQDLAAAKLKVGLMQPKQTSMKNDPEIVQRLERRATRKGRSVRQSSLLTDEKIKINKTVIR